MGKGGASWKHAREEKEETGRRIKSSGGRTVCSCHMSEQSRKNAAKMERERGKQNKIINCSTGNK